MSFFQFGFFYREFSKVKKENLYFLNVMIQTRDEQTMKRIADFGETLGQGKEVENILGDDEISRFLSEKYLKNYIDNILESYSFLKEVRLLKGDTIVFSSSDNSLHITPGSTITRAGDLLYRVDREETPIKGSYMLFIVNIIKNLSDFNTLNNQEGSQIAYIVDGTWAIVFDKKGNHSLYPVNEKSGPTLEIDQKKYLYSWKKNPPMGQVVISMDSYYKSVRITILLLSLFVVLSGIILLPVIKNTSRSLTKPLRRLSEVASSVKEGGLHQFIYEGCVVDEIKSLITSFNYMIDEVQDFTQKLEMEVQNRTKVIEEQKQSLELLNNELEMISVTDKLTGVYNRRSFDDIIKRDFDLAVRTKLFVGLGIMDIDSFKNINDTYGHLCGDTIIKGVAGLIKKSFKRSYDSVFRYGGDEFIIWTLNDKKKRDEFLSIAEKVRSEIQKEPFICTKDLKELHVTISIGLYFDRVNDKKDVSEILKIADEKLYKVKEYGGNRVIIDDSLL